MADKVIHANTKQRGVRPTVFGCGASRTRGVLITGDPKTVTCKDCKATAE